MKRKHPSFKFVFEKDGEKVFTHEEDVTYSWFIAVDRPFTYELTLKDGIKQVYWCLPKRVEYNPALFQVTIIAIVKKPYGNGN
jgi:hypothetical protein